MSLNQNWNLNQEEKEVLIQLGNCLLLFSTHLLRIVKMNFFSHLFNIYQQEGHSVEEIALVYGTAEDEQTLVNG